MLPRVTWRPGPFRQNSKGSLEAGQSWYERWREPRSRWTSDAPQRRNEDSLGHKACVVRVVLQVMGIPLWMITRRVPKRIAISCARPKQGAHTYEADALGMPRGDMSTQRWARRGGSSGGVSWRGRSGGLRERAGPRRHARCSMALSGPRARVWALRTPARGPTHRKGTRGCCSPEKGRQVRLHREIE